MSNDHLFEKITSSRIEEELRKNFSQGFLTLISIVLGVALAALAQRLFEIRESVGPSVGIHALTSFLTISGTFYYYNYFVSVITLRPNFIQVMLPFLLGSSIIGTAYTVGCNEYFWIANAILYAVAALTYFNTYLCNKTDLYASSAEAAYILIRNEEIKNVSCFFLMSAGTALFLLLSPESLLLYRDITLFAWNGAIYMICIALTELFFLKGIYGIVTRDRRTSTSK